MLNVGRCLFLAVRCLMFADSCLLRVCNCLLCVSMFVAFVIVCWFLFGVVYLVLFVRCGSLRDLCCVVCGHVN